MTRLAALAFRALEGGLLFSAALLVPPSRRREWRREWKSETWHVRKACVNVSAQWRTEGAVLGFCAGAFQDAWCLRREPRRDHAAPPALHGFGHRSAGQSLLCMAAVLGVCYALALWLPEVRVVRSSQQNAVRPGLILIEKEGQSNKWESMIPFARYRAWSTGGRPYFDGFAFYRMGRENVSAGAEAPGRWQIAYSSANLFALLGLPIRLASPDESGDGNLPRAILSYRLWKDEFGGNPAIVGSLLRIGQRPAKVAGVAPDRAWKLPGTPDAWLLEPDAEIPADGMGHIVAHLTRKGQAEMWAERVNITVRNADQTEQDYLGVSIGERTPGPWEIYRFAVLLALLALPAITSVSLGEYSVSSHKPPWPRRLLRWGFLGAKIALLLPIVYFASLDCAYWRASQHSSASEYAQLLLCFSICLFGIRWALLDQRQRCPVCLKRVTHPAQVGLASRTFLAWNGTELMCTGGHTLLHVPGLPTSWFSTQRWLYLDASWDVLFAGPEA